jgi:hypothetical protein
VVTQVISAALLSTPVPLMARMLLMARPTLVIPTIAAARASRTPSPAGATGIRLA